MFADMEDAIIERLKEKLPKDIAVLSASDLADVIESKQQVPAVHVVYQGYRVAENLNRGVASRVEQTWLCVIVVRNVRNTRSGKASRTDANVIADQVIPKLIGWGPEKATKRLKLATGPKGGTTNGFTYMPLAFTVETVFKAEQ